MQAGTGEGGPPNQGRRAAPHDPSLLGFLLMWVVAGRLGCRTSAGLGPQARRPSSVPERVAAELAPAQTMPTDELGMTGAWGGGPATLLPRHSW